MRGWACCSCVEESSVVGCRGCPRTVACSCYRASMGGEKTSSTIHSTSVKVSNICSSGSIDGLLSDAAAPELLGGPWGLTPEYGEFPVSTYFVEHATQGLGSFKQLAADFRKV